MKCPKCDNELDCDEVDIGVGTMKGNYHCNSCGWSVDDDLKWIIPQKEGEDEGEDV